MSLRRLLEHPLAYNLKTRLFSAGRANVWAYLRRFADRPPHNLVLDVGCGTGRHSAVFSCRFMGIDINADYIVHAATHHSGAFIVGDAEWLAFPDAAFDLVYAVGLFHHLTDRKARAAAREMKRVVNPRGRVIIVDAVVPRAWNVLGRVLFKLDRGEHQRNVGELTALLGEVGLALETANLRGSFPYQRAVWRYTSSELELDG